MASVFDILELDVNKINLEMLVYCKQKKTPNHFKYNTGCYRQVNDFGTKS